MASYIGVNGELVEKAQAEASTAPPSVAPTSAPRRQLTTAPPTQPQRLQVPPWIRIVVGVVFAALLIALVNGITPAVEQIAKPSAPLATAACVPTAPPVATPAPTAWPRLAPGLAVYFTPGVDLAPSLASATGTYTPTAV